MTKKVTHYAATIVVIVTVLVGIGIYLFSGQGRSERMSAIVYTALFGSLVFVILGGVSYKNGGRGVLLVGLLALLALIGFIMAG